MPQKRHHFKSKIVFSEKNLREPPSSSIQRALENQLLVSFWGRSFVEDDLQARCPKLRAIEYNLQLVTEKQRRSSTIAMAIDMVDSKTQVLGSASKCKIGGYPTGRVTGFLVPGNW